MPSRELIMRSNHSIYPDILLNFTTGLISGFVTTMYPYFLNSFKKSGLFKA